MVSTIKVDNIAPSAGGTEFSLTRGVAKAWVNFDGTGTIAVRDSENVSSLTDNGTADYSVNFTNDFDNTNYAASGCVGTTSPFSGSAKTLQPQTYAASSLRYGVVYAQATTLGVSDYQNNNLSLFGDLA